MNTTDGHTFERLFVGDAQVPSLPIIYRRINDAVNNPRCSTSDISAIIGDDPGLTSRLLRLVNSAFYGYPSGIGTISRALLIVGTHQLRDLALGTSIIELFKGISRTLVDMESFCRHSIACGLAAKILGTYCRTQSNVESFFVAGLIHDIGRLIIYKKKPESSGKALALARDRGELLHKSERAVFGFNHTDVGRLFIRRWNLPPSLEEVVAYHHNPASAVFYPMESAVIHVADIIANGMQLGSSGECLVPPLNERAWELLGLRVSVLSPVMDQLERETAEIQKLIFENA